MKSVLALAFVLVAACATKSAPPPKPKEAIVVDAGASPAAVVAPDADAKAAEPPPLTAGWVTTDYRTGRVDAVGRAAALDAVRKHPVRALVTVSSILEECSSMGGTHVFFAPAFSAERPFATAHLGGHGVYVPHNETTLLGAEKLFVAAVETHPPGGFGNGRGWCLERAPSFDGDVLALVPVQSQGEGMRLLSELSR